MTSTPTDLRTWIAYNVLANPAMPASSVVRLARRSMGTARGVKATVLAMVADGGLTLIGGKLAIANGPAVSL